MDLGKLKKDFVGGINYYYTQKKKIIKTQAEKEKFFDIESSHWELFYCSLRLMRLMSWHWRRNNLLIIRRKLRHGKVSQWKTKKNCHSIFLCCRGRILYGKMFIEKGKFLQILWQFIPLLQNYPASNRYWCICKA